MKNRKGFTITELVIVIAVIAILAAVLIPTFSGMIKKANDSSITQETRAAVTILLTEKNGQIPAGTYFIYAEKNSDGTVKAEHWFIYENGKLVEMTDDTAVATAKGYYKETAEDKDEVYAKAATSAIFKSGDPATADDVTKQLEDLSANVEIFVNG